jgi:hypothetical protein
MQKSLCEPEKTSLNQFPGASISQRQPAQLKKISLIFLRYSIGKTRGDLKALAVAQYP